MSLRALRILLLFFLLNLILSFVSVLFTAVGKLVDFEFYYEVASYSLIEIICFGERNKVAADLLTKQTVHSYLVPFAWRRHFHILGFFLDLITVF